MRASTALAVRSGIVAVALGLAFAMGLGRAKAETPTAFNLAQAGAIGQTEGHSARYGNPHFGKPAKVRIYRDFNSEIHPSPVSIFASDVVREAERFLGSGNPTGRAGAWCAWFVSFVLERTGHKPLSSGMAYSALYYGPHLASPRPGALIVLRGHVGVVAAVHGSSVTMVSGNWGHAVRMAEIPTRAAIAFIGIP